MIISRRGAPDAERKIEFLFFGVEIYFIINIC